MVRGGWSWLIASPLDQIRLWYSIFFQSVGLFLWRMIWVYFKMHTLPHSLTETVGVSFFLSFSLESGRAPRGKTHERVGVPRSFSP